MKNMIRIHFQKLSNWLLKHQIWHLCMKNNICEWPPLASLQTSVHSSVKMSFIFMQLKLYLTNNMKYFILKFDCELCQRKSSFSHNPKESSPTVSKSQDLDGHLTSAFQEIIFSGNWINCVIFRVKWRAILLKPNVSIINNHQFWPEKSVYHLMVLISIDSCRSIFRDNWTIIHYIPQMWEYTDELEAPFIFHLFLKNTQFEKTFNHSRTMKQ